MTTTQTSLKINIKPSTSAKTINSQVPATATATKALDPMALLLKNHMQNFVAKMAAEGTLTGEGQKAAMEQVSDMMSTITIPAAPARTRTKKVVDSDNRCMARVWGGGEGTQCTYGRKSGCGDYCNRCHKKSEVTEEPLQFNEVGKHVGLHWGRIDQDKPIMSGGFVAVQWKDPACAEKVTKALAAGATFHPHSGEAKKKVKGPRKPRGVKKSKSKKPKARRTKNAFFHFLGDTRAAKKAELIAAAKEGEKVGVSDVTKALGAIWKTMDADARAPYIKLETAEKAVAQAEFEASLATINDTEETISTINDTVGLGNDEVGQILAEGFAGDNGLDDMIADLSSEEVVTEVEQSVAKSEDAVEVEQDDEDGDDDEDGESVEEHEVADGTKYYLGSDGTLYDVETSCILGTLNEETNSLVPSA
jgi:hypothetical protein